MLIPIDVVCVVLASEAVIIGLLLLGVAVASSYDWYRESRSLARSQSLAVAVMARPSGLDYVKQTVLTDAGDQYFSLVH